MLMKCDVNELRKFTEKYKGFFSKEYMEKMRSAPDPVLEIALHKMIVNVITLPIELRVKSKNWLNERGFDLLC